MERAPHPLLGSLVRSIWLSAPGAARGPAAATHERMMPTGEMHLVFRLDGPAVRIAPDLASPATEDLGHALVNGARAGAYCKEVSEKSVSIGVQLRPGAARALLGVPADELAGRHLRLEDLWGADAALMREQLMAEGSAADKLHRLETLLLQRLRARPAQALHAAVAAALPPLRAGRSVNDLVRQSGYSHRQFIRLFSQAVGLPPRLYARVLRFQNALQLMQGQGLHRPLLADVALHAGYSDQPHFNRDFREFSGLTPEQYRAARPVTPNHVPVALPGR